MRYQTEIGTQTFGSSSETIELIFRQEPVIETTVNETSAEEPSLKSVDKSIKQATDPILRRVEELRALLAGRIKVEYGIDSEASGLGRNHESISPSRDRYDK